MSFPTYEVQVDSTAILFSTMSGTDQTDLQLIDKEGNTFVKSTDFSSSSSSATPTPILYFPLPNPPPSPIQDSLEVPVVDPVNNFTSQLMEQLTCEVSLRESTYGLVQALAESAVRNGHTFITEEKYEDYTAQSPFHQAENCRTAAWVVLYQGTLGRPPFHERDMLSLRSRIHLFDTALALCYIGFEQPMLYAELGGPLYHENGYHFFGSTPHLCVVTGAFLPICLDRVTSLIAIPDALIYPAFRLNIPACMDTIGQQVKTGGHYVYPPLCEWERDPDWRHPEWYKIEQWMQPLQ